MEVRPICIIRQHSLGNRLHSEETNAISDTWPLKYWQPTYEEVNLHVPTTEPSVIVTEFLIKIVLLHGNSAENDIVALRFRKDYILCIRDILIIL